MLTNDQIKAFQTNGYLAVENVISAEELEELRGVTEEFVERSRGISESNSTFDLEPGHTADLPQLRRITRPVDQHQIYAKYVHHQSILDIVESLIGPNLRYHNNKVNMKNPGHGSAVEWHQDWAFYPHTNDDLLEVGIALDDMTEENGALMVIPGSHKGKTWDHHQDGLFVGAVTDPKFEPNRAVSLKVKAGGITLHHVRMVHGSKPNESDKSRRMFFIGFYAVDAWPLIPTGQSLEEMDKCIVRGQSSLEPRLKELPVRLSLPRVEGGSIYAQQEKLRNTLLGTRSQNSSKDLEGE
ncbi:MAG: phytanoyl-CoA dioxygenase family protein [Candidatus Azotimanducaceae bacterium]|uniref:Phytanoyl-CoA dioxygenase family protein n=1 Tax=OM182 bacterium TaxID=2510334 RepID=A0A520RX62_9GAMM|nr:phytanoyl-CoA dioxygenase [Gammaproteobacteria bacterium]OUV67357.1 MAG: phytanoyl-CoA dioxygenase [Gammaproteobacteria bacterium TMED133]RZO74774.1 MAG: phytanoyl-CoA dioxygenase family protein [OM182 bacterium]